MLIIIGKPKAGVSLLEQREKDRVLTEHYNALEEQAYRKRGDWWAFYDAINAYFEKHKVEAGLQIELVKLLADSSEMGRHHWEYESLRTMAEELEAATSTPTVIEPKENAVTPPPVAASTDARGIYIPLENVGLIYGALAPYFGGQETELGQLLNGKRIEKPLDWRKNANQLTHIFWSAIRKGFISGTNVQICEWILENFRYKNGKEFDRDSVKKDLNTQGTRCKKPLPNLSF